MIPRATTSNSPMRSIWAINLPQTFPSQLSKSNARVWISASLVSSPLSVRSTKVSVLTGGPRAKRPLSFRSRYRVVERKRITFRAMSTESVLMNAYDDVFEWFVLTCTQGSVRSGITSDRKSSMSEGLTPVGMLPIKTWGPGGHEVENADLRSKGRAYGSFWSRWGLLLFHSRGGLLSSSRLLLLAFSFPWWPEDVSR